MSDFSIEIDATLHRELIRALSENLKTYYVFPEVAETIGARLQEYLDSGEYAEIRTGEEMAAVLTIHLQKVSQDKHLNVRWHPHPLPEKQIVLHENQEWLEDWKQQTLFDNYGLHKVERLPGNVGCLDIRSFSTTRWAGNTAVAAMNFLAHTSALIVDLRQCRGGNPDMVALISTYLFGEERVHLNSLYWRETDTTDQFWTLPYVPGSRYENKPVYVLTSAFTFSAGEEFAYNLKMRQRATLVGETTGGGAHPGAAYRLHPHFDAFIPSGRAINPISGINWEGNGVEPDILIPQEQAFTRAYRLALEAVLQDLQNLASRPAIILREEAEKEAVPKGQFLCKKREEKRYGKK